MKNTSISKVKTALTQIVMDSSFVTVYRCMGMLRSIVDQAKKETKAERNLYDTLFEELDFRSVIV